MNLGLSQSWNMQKVNQNGYERGRYSSAVAKQLHASKSVEFKQWTGSNFPGDWFQCCAYFRGALAVRAEVCPNRVCVCVFSVWGGWCLCAFVCTFLHIYRLCVRGKKIPLLPWKVRESRSNAARSCVWVGVCMCVHTCVYFCTSCWKTRASSPVGLEMNEEQKDFLLHQFHKLTGTETHSLALSPTGLAFAPIVWRLDRNEQTQNSFDFHLVLSLPPTSFTTK